MRTQRSIIISIAVAFTFALQLLNSSTAAAAGFDDLHGLYAAKLISPRRGEVVYPGQTVRVVWESVHPKLPVDLSWCETEIWLSLDGGKTFTSVITPVDFAVSAGTLSFDWTVPNFPTTKAVLDIRFGCQQFFPESRSVQARSAFVIGKAGAQ